MSQNDFSLANQGFPSMRADMNSALQALASTSAGATEPATMYAYQLWYDETDDLLKMRNGVNDAWITLASFDQAANEWEIRSAIVQAVDAAGVSIKTDDGITRLRVADSGNVGVATDTPLATLDVGGTGALKVPVGTDAQRPTPATGLLRFNSEASAFEGYDGTEWAGFGGGGGGGFNPTTVSGASQALDLGAANFFDAGALTADATISFTNVPTEARWTYTFESPALTSFDIATASYDGVSFSVAGQEATPTSLAFNNDGTKMFIVGSTSRRVYQYTLLTAFNVGTASYDGVSFSVAALDASPQGLAFNNDGTKMFIVGAGNDTVYQYTLSTAFNVGTASYDSVSFSVAGQEATPTSLAFNNDGTKMFIVGSTSDTVYQYTLSTAFNVGTASYDSVSFSVVGQETVPQGLAFSNDGTKMFIVGTSADTVYQYTLSTAFNLGTASYDSVSFSVTAQEATPTSLAFNNDGTKMFIVGSTSDTVYQYTTGLIATITVPASVQNPPTEALTFNGRVAYDFFTLDGGTNVYLIGEEVL